MGVQSTKTQARDRQTLIGAPDQMGPVGLRQTSHAQNTVECGGIIRLRQHANLICNHTEVLPIGKFWVFLQWVLGVDVSQRIVGVDKHKAFDLFPLKTSLKQGFLQLVHSQLEQLGIHLSYLTVQVDMNQLNFPIQVGRRGEASKEGVEIRKASPGLHRTMVSEYKTEQ